MRIFSARCLGVYARGASGAAGAFAAAGAAVVAAPQASQKRAPAGSSAPHAPHRAASGLPHAAQNFAPARLAWPQAHDVTRRKIADLADRSRAAGAQALRRLRSLRRARALRAGLVPARRLAGAAPFRSSRLRLRSAIRSTTLPFSARRRGASVDRLRFTALGLPLDHLEKLLAVLVLVLLRSPATGHLLDELLRHSHLGRRRLDRVLRRTDFFRVAELVRESQQAEDERRSADEDGREVLALADDDGTDPDLPASSAAFLAATRSSCSPSRPSSLPSEGDSTAYRSTRARSRRARRIRGCRPSGWLRRRRSRAPSRRARRLRRRACSPWRCRPTRRACRSTC